MTHEPFTGDVQLVRRLNRDAVLRLIQERGPISRTSLARLTHLTPATAFSIVDDLIASDLVREVGIGESGGGRRPMLFEFKADARVVIGINIRSEEIRGIISYLDAVPLRTVTRDFEPASGADVVEPLVQVIEELLAASPLPPERLLGIGLAVPGLIDRERGVVVESVNWGWYQYPLRDLLAARVNFPIFVEEDDNALALGEGMFGAGRGVPDVICLKIGRGMGAGLIIDGRLFRGPDNTAGEIGHILVDPDGPRCECGNYGCLVRMANAAAVAERAIKGLKQGAESMLREQVGDDLDRVTMKMVANAAHAGDPFACRIMEDTGRYLGIGVAALVNLLNPDLVIVSGAVGRAGGPLLHALRHVVKLRTLSAPGRRVEIVPAQLDVDAPAIGASALVMMQTGVLPGQGAGSAVSA